MFQRDYVLRLIEQLAKSLGAFVRLKKAKRFDEAQTALAEAAKNVVGIDVDTLLALSLDHVLALFSPGGSLDAGKCLVVAELLYEDGALSELRGDAPRACSTRLHAAGLLLEVFTREGSERVPNAERYLRILDELDAGLSLYEPSVDLTRRRAHFHARLGRFDRAEDILFALIEAGNDDILPEAIELYERWLAEPEDALERGGLPRAEVEEGLAQLRARAAVVESNH